MKTKRFKIESESNSVLAKIGDQIKGCESLREVAESLRFESSPFHDWMIYEGGNHVAIHKASGLSRVAIVTTIGGEVLP